jgi:hypothetical protein
MGYGTQSLSEVWAQFGPNYGRDSRQAAFDDVSVTLPRDIVELLKSRPSGALHSWKLE